MEITAAANHRPALGPKWRRSPVNPGASRSTRSMASWPSTGSIARNSRPLVGGNGARTGLCHELRPGGRIRDGPRGGLRRYESPHRSARSEALGSQPQTNGAVSAPWAFASNTSGTASLVSEKRDPASPGGCRREPSTKWPSKWRSTVTHADGPLVQTMFWSHGPPSARITPTRGMASSCTDRLGAERLVGLCLVRARPARGGDWIAGWVEPRETVRSAHVLRHEFPLGDLRGRPASMQPPRASTSVS